MKMLIGLTGRTGSGKSSAARILESLGGFVTGCDKVSHEVLLDNTVKEKLCALFSDAILNEKNEIDRKALGSIVFSDKKKLDALNGVVHKEIVERCLKLCRDSGRDICFMDGSELESSGADRLCDHIVVIKADEKTRLERIMKRDAIDRETALRRIQSQTDYSKDAIFIDNCADEKALEEKITALYNQFLGEINA